MTVAVAVVDIIEKNGAGGTPTTKTDEYVRFKSADDSNVDTNDKMPITGWSYEKWLRLNVTTAPENNISNIKFYTDGNNDWTGLNLWAKSAASYSTPIQPSSSSGFTDAFSYTPSSPLLLGAGPFTGTGEKGDHIVLAMEGTGSGSAGQVPTEAGIFVFDES